MLAPLNWLKEYTDINVPIEDFVDKMTMTGTKVEGYKVLGEEINKVVVGKILSIEKHPNADKLVVCNLNIGDEVIQIVTGAPNVFAGALVPVALHGSSLPGGVSIKKGKLRGIESYGMMCSGEELGLKEDDYPGAEEYGILILKEEYPLGMDIKKALGLNDIVIEFEITPNRPDCLSIVGLAREAAVTLNESFRFPVIKVEETNEVVEQYAKVDVIDPELCPRYTARVVKNIRIEPSPKWMQQYLKASGIRPINNIVDVTNYVMLELGQPLHAFDINKVKENHVIVRRGKEGEIFKTLDGRERELHSDMLVIADPAGPIGIAGVMGGENSEITTDTKTILIESAKFQGSSIRTTAKSLGMRTEASSRFEKGLDVNNVETALNRAAQLIQEMGAGEVVSGIIDVCNADLQEKVLEVSSKRINDLLGLNLLPQEMVDILNKLFISAELKDNNNIIRARIPSFRGDIEGMADLAEEILRIYGYDHIPSTLMRGPLLRGRKTETQKSFDKVKSILAGLGLYEITTYSFVSPKVFDLLNLPEEDTLRKAVRISNPLGEDQSIMRTTLIPGMLEVLSTNISRRLNDIKLFEMSRVYLPEILPLDDLPKEKNYLTIGLSGEQVDFYTLKGIVEAILKSFKISNVDYLPDGKELYHPGRKALIYANQCLLGSIGEVHPDVAAAFDINRRVYIGELDFNEIINNINYEYRYKPLPKFPAITRDLALLTDENVPVGDLEKQIRNSGGKLLESVNLFDVYKGKQVPPGYKSVAFSLIFRSDDRTLMDEEVKVVYDKMIKALEEKCNATLRI